MDGCGGCSYVGLKFLTDLVKWAQSLGLDGEVEWLTAMPYATLLTVASEVQQVLLM